MRKSFICINCKSKTSDIDEKSALKCVNCNLKMRKSDMICNSTANLIIKNENGENAGRYNCPHSAMQDIFHKISSADGYTIDKDVSKLSADVMEDTLLNVPKLTFDVLSEEKVIKGIELCNYVFFWSNYSNYFSKLSADVMEYNVLNYVLKLCTSECQAGGGGGAGGWGSWGIGQGFD